jgi:indole-3-glycerol phosphate synthase
MNILDKIIANKKTEIDEAKKSVSVQALEKSAFFNRNTISVKKTLIENTKVGIISEHKRKSPSKGVINDKLSVEFITNGYVKAGASCLSILTDSVFFGGSKEDLILARKANPTISILRKDFIIDEYQILEAKSWGADVILLIAANLKSKQLKSLARFAKSLGLDVLMEVHDKEELMASIDENLDLIGVNNRNLKTFEVSIQTSLDLANDIPNQFVKIAESGLNSASEIVTLQKAGFKGFLIGESFMKTNDPGAACSKLIADCKQYYKK